MREEDKTPPGGKVTRRKFIQKTLMAGAVVSVPWFLADGNLWAAPADDVRAAFYNAVQAFNDKQPKVLGPLLDPYVKLKKIHFAHAKPVISERQPVLDYLSEAWNGTHPATMIFTPYSGAQRPVVKFQGPHGAVAVVTGLACWQDDDGDKEDGEISYKFEFKDTGGNWLVTSLYGFYTATPPKQCPDHYST